MSSNSGVLRFSFGEFVGAAAVVGAASSALVGAAEVAGWLLPGGRLLGYGLVLGLVMILMLGFSVMPMSQRLEGLKKNGGTAEAVVTLGGTLFSAILFGQICRELEVHDLAPFANASEVGWWAWTAFGIDNLLESVLFDLPTIYDLHLSEVHPAGFRTRTMLVGYRLLVDLVLLRAILSLIKAIKEARKVQSV
jgi:hypothetical protein